MFVNIEFFLSIPPGEDMGGGATWTIHPPPVSVPATCIITCREEHSLTFTVTLSDQRYNVCLEKGSDQLFVSCCQCLNQLIRTLFESHHKSYVNLIVPLSHSATYYLFQQQTRNQCFGSGSGQIRIIGSDLDPLQESLIWIRVPKKNRDKLAYNSTLAIEELCPAGNDRLGPRAGGQTLHTTKLKVLYKS